MATFCQGDIRRVWGTQAAWEHPKHKRSSPDTPLSELVLFPLERLDLNVLEVCRPPPSSKFLSSSSVCDSPADGELETGPYIRRYSP